MIQTEETKILYKVLLMYCSGHFPSHLSPHFPISPAMEVKCDNNSHGRNEGKMCVWVVFGGWWLALCKHTKHMKESFFPYHFSSRFPNMSISDQISSTQIRRQTHNYVSFPCHNGWRHATHIEKRKKREFQIPEELARSPHKFAYT